MPRCLSSTWEAAAAGWSIWGQPGTRSKMWIFSFFKGKRKSTNVENSNQVKSCCRLSFQRQRRRSQAWACEVLSRGWQSPASYAYAAHRRWVTVTDHLPLHWLNTGRGISEQRLKETYLINFLWDWHALQFTPTWKRNSFFLLVLVSRTFWGHHPWEDRCQKDSASYTVTNCGDLGTPEPLCHCFWKKGGGGFSKQKTLTTDDFVVVVVLTLLGKLGYFSESHVTWAWSLTPVSPELGKLGH